MDGFIQRQTIDLGQSNPVLVREQPIVKDDAQALIWVVTIRKNGVLVDLAGAEASLYCARSASGSESESGTTFSGATVGSDGTVTATLPTDAANVPGPVGCMIRVTRDGASVAVARMAVMAVDLTGNNIIDVGKRVPNLDEVVAAVLRCEKAADKAEAAASKIDTMTVTAIGLDAGSAPTAELTEVDGRYTLALGVPKGDKGEPGDIGPQGPQGEPGKDAPQEAVLYTAQELDGAQKAQARENINAASEESVSQLKKDIGNIEDIAGKRVNGIFSENNYFSALTLEAGTTYYIFYESGSTANFYVNGDTSTAVTVNEGEVCEFTPKITGIACLFRNTIDSKNDITFYIGTDLTFFRDIREIEKTYIATQAEIEEHSEKIDAVETSVNELFVKEKITETNDRSAITQTITANYCIGISNKINSGTKIKKITFGTELTKEPYILFVDANGAVLRKWTIKSKVLNIDYTTEADGFFIYHCVGDSNFKWKAGVTDGSMNTLIFQYVDLYEAEIAVGENMSKPYFNNSAKVWVDCEITAIEMNYEAFKDNKYRGKKIAFLGDSITQGLTWNGSAQVYVDKPYPMTVAEKLKCDCQNVGHSSYPISSIGKAQCFNTTYVEIDRDVDYIFVFGGTNDFQYSVPVGTIADREDVSFCGAIFTLINKIRTRIPTAKLVFFTPLHRSTEINSDGTNLMDYVNAIRDVCELCAIPVVDLYKNSGFSNVVTEMEQYYADGLHLTQDGYNLLGAVISELILVH